MLAQRRHIDADLGSDFLKIKPPYPTYNAGGF